MLEFHKNNGILDRTFSLIFDMRPLNIYTYFLDNEQISGLRELNSTELNNFCMNQSTKTSPISNQSLNFTANLLFFDQLLIGIMFFQMLILFEIKQFI